MLICRQKNQLHLSRFLEILQRYCELVILATLDIPRCIRLMWYYQLVGNFRVSLQTKKSASSAMFFWRYCKDMQTSYSGFFGHAWLRTPKMIISTCRKRQCLSACQKYTSSLTSFLRYYILKNPAIWLADSILTHNSSTRIMPDMGLVVKYQN